MAADAITIARPYAEAVFARAQETGRLAEWGDTLEFLAAVVADPRARAFLVNPAVDQQQRVELMLEVAGERLDDEGRNLVRLLAENGRLVLLPEIARLYQEMRNEQEGQLDVRVSTACALDPELEKALGEALERKLGRKVRLSTEEDPGLIGGVKIRAGDLVIDGSVAGQLARLANELGIQTGKRHATQSL